MKYLSGLFKLVNANWASRGFTLVLICLLTYSAVNIFVAKGKAKCEDCKPYQQIAQDIINALSNKEITYEGNESPYKMAVYFQDTLKPLTVKQYNSYKDSVLKCYQKKLDSLKRKK